MAGSVFLWEGLIEFYFANQETGRFAKLGFPAPNLIATATAWLEIIGVIFLIVGLSSRPVALLFVIEMLDAMLSLYAFAHGSGLRINLTDSFLSPTRMLGNISSS